MPKRPMISNGLRRRPSRAALVLLLGLLTTAAWVGAQPAALSQAELLARIRTLCAVGDLNGAIELTTAQLDPVRASGDSIYLGELLVQYGVLLASMGQARPAEEVLREGLPLVEAARDTALICTGLRWLGVSLLNQGGGAESEELSRQLLDLARAAGDSINMGWAHTGLGWEALQRGQATASLEHYQEALALFQDTETWEGAGMAWIGLARAHYQLGNYDQVLRDYRMCEQVATRIEVAGHRTYVLNTAVNNLGTLEFQFGDPGEAMKYFERAKQMALEIGHPRAAIPPWLNLALCHGKLGHLSEANDMYAEIVATCRERNYLDKLGGALILWGHNRRAMNRLEEAADLFRQALAMGAELQMSRRIEAALGLADVQSAADSTAAAFATLDAAERLLAANPDVELQRTLVAHRGAALLADDRPAEALPLCLWVADEEARLGITRWNLKALSVAARACRQLGWPDSARVLLERAARVWEADRGLPLDPEWREIRAAKSSEVYTDLAFAILETSERGTREAFDRLQIFKARTLMERLRGPSGAAPAAPERLTTVTELQEEVLAPGEVFLDVYLGPRASLLLAVTPSTCRLIPWPAEDELDAKFSLLRRLIAVPPAEAGAQVWDVVDRNLRADLFSEIDSLLTNAERIFFSPDGSINKLPLALLLSREVVRMPSATYLMHLRGADEARGTLEAARVIALGGSRTCSGSRLPGALEEVRELADRYEAVACTAADHRIPAILTDFEILHIAAHAEINDRNPWRSVIMLDPDRPDTWLQADRIAALPLRARLAVLSSCGTAQGGVISGEGVLSLCHAFLSAGVPAVVATLWPVDDRATVLFMGHFYRGLAAGSPPVEALRRARERLRREATYAHPFYWAGFTLVGLAEQPIPLAAHRGVNPLLLAGIILLAALILWRPAARALKG